MTVGEKNMIAKSMKLVEEVTSKAKRFARTAHDLVEKFLYRPGNYALIGLSVAKMDVSAVTLFAELWLLTTYA